MRKFLSILSAVAVFSLIALPVFSQNNKDVISKAQEEQAPAAETAPAAAPEPVTTLQTAQPEEMSIYGEVKSVDEASSSVKLQYYDYDNDEEKTADIIIDKDTKLENAAVLKDIKQGDWVDAVYLAKDGKNMAKSVIVEKEEEEAPSAASGVSQDEKKAGAMEGETPAAE